MKKLILIACVIMLAFIAREKYKSTAEEEAWREARLEEEARWAEEEEEEWLNAQNDGN